MIGCCIGAAPTSAGRVHAGFSVLPPSHLGVFVAGRWRTWWDARNAPAYWRKDLPIVANSVRWRPTEAAGVESGQLRVAGDGEAWRLDIILVRLDPHRVSLRLEKAIRADSLAGAWKINSAPSDAVLAIDAGQFSYGRPWGWVVRRGVEEQPPGRGPLSTGVMVDSSGNITLISGTELVGVPARAHPAEAFQSYPTLLTGDGDIPAPVRGKPADSANAIDLAHRDSRLALGQLRDGRILIALTRFDGLGGVLDFVPFGPTVPEMAAIMGALGCRSAVMLDGGISGQMLLREPGGATRTWPGLRDVPLGLIVTTRSATR